MTRMPLVRRLVQESCGREPNTSVHPDAAMALGAAIQADGLRAHAKLAGAIEGVPNSRS
jgi:molecular chaperone DnaK (HSP70)